MWGPIRAPPGILYGRLPLALGGPRGEGQLFALVVRIILGPLAASGGLWRPPAASGGLRQPPAASGSLWRPLAAPAASDDPPRPPDREYVPQNSMFGVHGQKKVSKMSPKSENGNDPKSSS